MNTFLQCISSKVQRLKKWKFHRGTNNALFSITLNIFIVFIIGLWNM